MNHQPLTRNIFWGAPSMVRTHSFTNDDGSNCADYLQRTVGRISCSWSSRCEWNDQREAFRDHTKFSLLFESANASRPLPIANGFKSGYFVNAHSYSNRARTARKGHCSRLGRVSDWYEWFYADNFTRELVEKFLNVFFRVGFDDQYDMVNWCSKEMAR